MTLAYVALGSNLSEPLAQLRQARVAIGRLGDVVATSRLYRTAPVGGPAGQPDYLNAVTALRPVTDEPAALLESLLELEQAQGRTRAVRWDARTLDLDLLAWGDLVCRSEILTLPHPRMMTRAFVLEPLCELEPLWRHPLTGELACEVLAGLPRTGIERTDLVW